MATPTIAVYADHGWADVIAIVRDLLGMKVYVWQDRTGKVGAMPASLASLRINGIEYPKD